MDHEQTRAPSSSSTSELPTDQARTEDPAAALFPAPASRGLLQRKIARRIQRKEGDAPDIDDQEIASAIAWAAKERLGGEAIKEVQKATGAAESGHYDEATARAVFHKQREWYKHGKIAGAGRATREVFQRLGLIYTHEIAEAAVTDKELDAVKKRFPSGVTVAIYPDFKAGVSGREEFASQAGIFAANQSSAGLSGGAVALGVAVPIKEVGEVIEVVQGIHRGLLHKHRETLKASGADKDAAAAIPDYTRVKNLALFCHGEDWGMGLNASNDFSAGGLHNKTTHGVNPANVQAFVRGLADAVVKGVRVELFACSTGADAKKSSYEEWTQHKQGEKAGADSFGASLATALGPDASVSAHTTAGHTTENYAARVFGKEAGGGAGGLSLFDALYDDAFVRSELARLFADKSDDDRKALHDSLREQMWAHFKDAILGDHHRAPAARRYPVPMGQETFTNPDHARVLLRADWTKTWIPAHIKDVHAAPKPKAKK